MDTPFTAYSPSPAQAHRSTVIALAVAWLVLVITLIISLAALRKAGNVPTPPPPPAAPAAPAYFRSSFPIPAKGYVVEGVAWDPSNQRFLFGSLATGGLFALQPGTGLNTAGTGLNDAISRTNPGGQLPLGVVGIFIDNGGSRDVGWAAMGNFPPNPTDLIQGAVGRQDRVSGMASYVDLTGLKSNPSLPMLINDVVTDDAGVAYLTNTFDGQIIRAEFNATSGVIVPSVLLQDATLRFNGLGLNGIEHSNGVLIVGVSQPYSAGGGLYRVPISNPNAFTRITVRGGVAERVDGIRLSQDKRTLYVVVSPDKVVVLTSTDNWTSADLTATWCIPSQCAGPMTTITDVPGLGAQYVMCSNNFGPGPYSITKITGSKC